MAQDFWINPDTFNNGFETGNYVKIQIPDYCPKCNVKLEVDTHRYTNNASTFKQNCAHTGEYRDVWAIRIQTNQEVIPPAKRCDCGGTKCNTTHSKWCSVYGA